MEGEETVLCLIATTVNAFAWREAEENQDKHLIMLFLVPLNLELGTARIQVKRRYHMSRLARFCFNILTDLSRRLVQGVFTSMAQTRGTSRKF
jgi:hypothetical protein